MTTLYAIREDLNALHALLAEVGGDVSEEAAEQAVDAWLRETGEAVAEKLDAYAGLIREVEARGAARKAEADRLAALATTDANTVKRLKERLRWFFEDQGLDKVETPRFRVTLANNGGARPVVLSCAPEELPDAWRRKVVTVRAELDAIRTALEDGDELPFASLGDRGKHVRIR